MQKSQNTIILHQANDSLCNSHVYIYEHIFPLIEFICLHHVDHIANTCAEADFNWLWDTLLPCLRFCCYSRVVSLLQLYSNIVAVFKINICCSLEFNPCSCWSCHRGPSPPWLPDLKCWFCQSLPSLQRGHYYLLWLHNFSISEELVLEKLSLMHRFAFSMPCTQRFRTHGRPLFKSWP